MLKVNNRNTGTTCKIWSKLRIKILVSLLLTSIVSTVNFNQVNAGWEQAHD